MSDERRTAEQLLGQLQVSTFMPLLWFCIALMVAIVVAFVPAYPDLPWSARRGLFILVFAAALWLTEAIPAFAVSLVVMALALLMLPDIAPQSAFLAPWASPVIWLFFGGFVLAAAAVRSGLDRWISAWVLGLTGNRPDRVLFGAMASTFVFSMFMSNTATATMMLSVLMPVIATRVATDPLRKALPLGIAFGANIGGMATIIGSPPNAIAAGLLQDVNPVSFLTWSLAALPVAVVLGIMTWCFLVWRYPSDVAVDFSALRVTGRPNLPLWQRLVIMAVFMLTILLWLTTSWHQIPSAVVSFLPITILTMTRAITVDNIRSLPWDVLLLIAGGLTLGEVIDRTGLSTYLVSVLPIDDLGPIALALGLAWACSILSNFMSNTAASNILLPIALAFTGGQLEYVIPVALAASSAMCLPVSTPPNALAASHGGLNARDFLAGGLLVGAIATPLSVYACFLVFART